MLLDKYVLTQGLSALLSHSPSATAHAHSISGYQKRVATLLARLDPLLKTLQVRPAPPEGLVQAYLIHIADRSEANFRKVLELKGVRKAEQPHLVELFAVHRDSPKQTDLVASSALLTPLALGEKGIAALGLAAGAAGAGAAPFGAGSAAAFGEKLFSAARDGMERMGTGSPVMGVGAREGGVERVEATVQENLRGIGKFFRRDISGGFGGRFGRANGEEGK